MSDKSNLKSKTQKGLIWSAAERFSVQGVQFILGLILARLLLPSDYGLIGMLAIFLAISQSMVDSGFGSALIQKKDRSETDYATVFYFNIVIGLVFYGILFLTAPLIASFYKAPELVSLTRVMGLNIFITSFAVVQRAKLTVALDFKTQAKASLISVVVAGITGISMAYLGYGVWSLVVQAVLRVSFETILLWFFSKWKPSAEYSGSSLKQLFGFGSKLLGAGLLNTIFDNIYLIVIGKLFNATELGFYTRAKQFEQMPSRSITGLIQRVAFPVMSEVQDDAVRLNGVIKRFLRLAVYIIFPVMVVLGILAEPLTRLVLTEKWMQIVPLIQILCISGMLYPVHVINLNILNALGRSDLFLKLEIVKKVLIVIAILVTFPYGVKNMVIGQVLVSVLSFFINTFYSGRIADFGIIRQIKELMPVLGITLLMGSLVWFVSSRINSDAITLVVSLLTAGTVYLVSSILLKFDEIKELKLVFSGK